MALLRRHHWLLLLHGHLRAGQGGCHVVLRRAVFDYPPLDGYFEDNSKWSEANRDDCGGHL